MSLAVTLAEWPLPSVTVPVTVAVSYWAPAEESIVEMSEIVVAPEARVRLDAPPKVKFGPPTSVTPPAKLSPDDESLVTSTRYSTGQPTSDVALSEVLPLPTSSQVLPPSTETCLSMVTEP